MKKIAKMETPTKYESSVPIQRLSERKRALFSRGSLRSESFEDIGPMSPLQFSSSPMRLSSGQKHHNQDEGKNKTTTKKLIPNNYYKFLLDDQENFIRGNEFNTNINGSKRRILTDIGAQNKVIKLSEAVIQKSPNSVISTKSFYSKPVTDIAIHYKRELPKLKKDNSKNMQQPTKSKKRGGFKVFGLINKGVGHKIFKPRPIIKKSHKSSPTVKNIVKILKTNSNDLSVLEKSAEERISSQQILRIQNIMKNLKNPIEMARPLSVDFKTKKYLKENNQEIVELGNEYEDPPGKRKLLKSKHSFNNKYRVTDKISATFCKGKISFIANKDAQQFKLSEEFENTDERMEIDGIINRLDDSQNIVPAEVNIPNISDENEPIDYENLIPYKTSDPIVIEQQQNMLDFLLCNNICNEENIKIFITEPESHKDEASKILNDLIVITNESDLQSIENTEIYEEESEKLPQIISPTSQISNLTSSLQIVNTNEEIEERVFPIFKKGFTVPSKTNEAQGKQINKIKWKPCGSDQLQIDAGQKRFGAKECFECGFIYSVCFLLFFFYKSVSV